MTGRINANRSSRSSAPVSLLLRTCVCLLVLLGSLAHSLVEGQYLRSPCPDVFAYRLDPATYQAFGYVELQGLRIGDVVKLNIDLSIGTSVPHNNIGSITLVKSNQETFRDIYNNEPAQYRVNFPFNNVIPNVLAISVNGQTICTGQKATGQIVTTINLEHTLFTQVQSQANGNGDNFNTVQNQQPQNVVPQAPVYQEEQTPVAQVPEYESVETPEPQAPVYHSVETSEPEITHSVEQDSSLEEDEPNFECGKPGNFYNQLSINGFRSPKGQFPWAAPIFDISVASKPKYICGSTIITGLHLVTAAHCMFDSSTGERRRINNFRTVPGMYYTNNFFDADLQVRKVSDITIHEDYYFEEGGVMEFDIAVLKVDQYLYYTDVVRPICLWNENGNLELIVGLQGFVSGWGMTEEGDAMYPSYVKATVVDRRSCSRNHGKHIPSSSRYFCADGHGSVPCNGDSGSGLVIKRGQNYYLRGIVSSGQRDEETLLCDAKKYVIYTDTAAFQSWLLNAIES